MKLSDKEELERYRAKRKRVIEYNSQYNKENYKRMVCMYPIERSDEIAEAMKQAQIKSVSAYLCMLVDRDLKERGLI